MKKERTCAIYTRVSTEEQNPQIQIDELKKIGSQQNIMVYDVYTDVVSGSRDSRPELNRLMFDMRKGLFNCVLIYKLDRLGRSLKHLITICEELHNKNIDLIVTSQAIDTSTASGKLLFNILGSVAEFEKELISERTKLGQKKAKNVGKRGKDKKPRRKSGYYRRWMEDGKKMGVP
jgi:DNA invertase Pin-like site-specific DNA recombinase